MMRHWREREFERPAAATPFRMALKLWAFLARRPALYRLATRLPMRVLGTLGRRRGRFASLPLAGGWTGSRDMPAPQSSEERRVGHACVRQWRSRWAAFTYNKTK